MADSYNYFWFRRDMRLEDNKGLCEALTAGRPVQPLFIFDSEILDKLPAYDKRVIFIWREAERLAGALENLGASLRVAHGKPLEIWEGILAEEPVGAIYANMDYEPYAKARDAAVGKLAKKHGAAFETFKDHVLLHKAEVMTQKDEPYKVFTPYKRQWLKTATEATFESAPSEEHFGNFRPCEKPYPRPSPGDMGFQNDEQLEFPARYVDAERIRRYHDRRNYPALNGATRLGPHLRFGTVSIRKLALDARELNDTFLSELIWRDFYAMLLDWFPYVVDKAFKPEYDAIPWRDDEKAFAAWREGRTGYPIVDAGMRELNETGYMHNRVRMITASFLTKHLLIDWRKGERYFAEKLLDYELSSNNGGWQWAAGSGADAAPYFRVFNPSEQTRKFDPEHKYVRKWVPEYQELDYPKPIVEHKPARKRAIDVYKTALEKAKK